MSRSRGESGRPAGPRSRPNNRTALSRIRSAASLAPGNCAAAALCRSTRAFNPVLRAVRSPDSTRGTRWSRSSVTPAIAETTTSGCDRARDRTISTRRPIASASCTDVPPNLQTIMMVRPRQLCRSSRSRIRSPASFTYSSTPFSSSALSILSSAVCATRIDPGPSWYPVPHAESSGRSLAKLTTVVSHPASAGALWAGSSTAVLTVTPGDRAAATAALSAAVGPTVRKRIWASAEGARTLGATPPLSMPTLRVDCPSSGSVARGSRRIRSSESSSAAMADAPSSG